MPAFRMLSERELLTHMTEVAKVTRAVLIVGQNMVEENPGEAGALLNAMRSLSLSSRRLLDSAR